eukprot:4133426-Amphidinium_carterae.1
MAERPCAFPGQRSGGASMTVPCGAPGRARGSTWLEAAPQDHTCFDQSAPNLQTFSEFVPGAFHILEGGLTPSSSQLGKVLGTEYLFKVLLEHGTRHCLGSCKYG